MNESVFLSAKPEVRDRYVRCLKSITSLSRLFSTSKIPYLDYRISENIFCDVFDAENLSRSCIAIDARVGKLGIGIKTFVSNSPFQKIAEFDKSSCGLMGDPYDDAKAISELRNLRLDFTRNTYGIESFLYHFILRREQSFSIHEEPMEYIDIDRICVTKTSASSIEFTDGRNRYRYNRSKSTLFKEFDLGNPLTECGVEFIDNPLEAIYRMSGTLDIEKDATYEMLILPLFSMRGGRHVPLKSGLNQWNAGGRRRDMDEVYIPYPKDLRDDSIGFFPSRDVPFRLILPDGSELSAKVCQDDGKAIMSNPNRDLGLWLLRKVLRTPAGELVTIEHLDRLNIDAVVFTKHPDHYRIDFTYIGDGSESRFE